MMDHRLRRFQEKSTQDPEEPDFCDAEHAREVIGEWIEAYNEEWILERHRYRSPREVRREIEAKGKEPVAA